MNEQSKNLVTHPQLERRSVPLIRTIKGHKRSSSVSTEAFKLTHMTAHMHADHLPTRPAPTPLLEL